MQQAGTDPARRPKRARATGARADVAPAKKRSAIAELVDALEAGAGAIGGKRLTAEQHALLGYAARVLRVVLDRAPAEVRTLKNCLYPRHAISEREVERLMVTLLLLARPITVTAPPSEAAK